jgi:hypothetical protein
LRLQDSRPARAAQQAHLRPLLLQLPLWQQQKPKPQMKPLRWRKQLPRLLPQRRAQQRRNLLLLGCIRHQQQLQLMLQRLLAS